MKYFMLLLRSLTKPIRQQRAQTSMWQPLIRHPVNPTRRRHRMLPTPVTLARRLQRNDNAWRYAVRRETENDCYNVALQPACSFSVSDRYFHCNYCSTMYNDAYNNKSIFWGLCDYRGVRFFFRQSVTRLYKINVRQACVEFSWRNNSPKMCMKTYPIYGCTSILKSGDLSPFSQILIFCVCDNEVYNVWNVKLTLREEAVAPHGNIM